MRRVSLPVIVAIAVAVLAGGAALALVGRPIEQPIAFNHRLHVEEVELDCTDCHRYVRKGARATIPNIGVCVDCHEEQVGDSIQESRVVEYVRDGVPIPWRQVYRVPSHVYFSHRRHVEAGQIACETCHGEIGRRERPVTRPAVRVTMGFCIDCHTKLGAANDCVLCHR